MNRTIYDISADLAALESILHENGGDVSDANAEAALAEWERELESDLFGKVDRYCSLIAELEARLREDGRLPAVVIPESPHAVAAHSRAGVHE
jgi:hypothetical protein